MTKRILIADDEPLYLRTTGELLRKEGYESVCVADADTAIKRLNHEDFDLVLSDLNMPGNLKLELLHDHSRRRKHIPMIVITGVPSLPSAIESIRLGITDYLLKPVKFETLLQSVRRAVQRSSDAQRIAAIPSRPVSELQALFPTIIGDSAAMLEVLEIVDRISATDASILVTGESGTGKEVIARAIHARSHRAAAPFQIIDCTAIPESLFESMLFGHKRGAFTGAICDQEGLLKQCDGGTAFFDEIGELPLMMQAKLLRAVQERTFTPVGSHTPETVNTRFVCATNRDLQSEVAGGRFRQDLFYRLGVINVELPPLRERGDDVLLLAEAFLRGFTKDNLSHPSVTGFAQATRNLLCRYRWPGNIRELRNTVERTVALSRQEMIQPSDLPSSVLGSDSAGRAATAGIGFGDSGKSVGGGTLAVPLGPAGTPSREAALKAAEYQYLRGLLQKYSGNVSQAARYAGLSRQGLHKLLKSYRLRAADYRQ